MNKPSEAQLSDFSARWNALLFLSRSVCNRLYDLIETRTNVNETFQRESTVQLFKVAAATGLDQTRVPLYRRPYSMQPTQNPKRVQRFRSWRIDTWIRFNSKSIERVKCFPFFRYDPSPSKINPSEVSSSKITAVIVADSKRRNGEKTSDMSEKSGLRHGRCYRTTQLKN